MSGPSKHAQSRPGRHQSHHLHRTAPNLSYTIRPASRSDLPAINSIYTYYVLNTTISFLLHKPDISYISRAYESTKSRRLPYLIAVTNTTFPPSRSTGPSPAVSTSHDRINIEDQDRITSTSCTPGVVLGYAHGSPLHDDKAGYAPSVELTMYLHPSYIGSGIGSSLLSRLEQEMHESPAWVFEEGHEDLGHEVRVDRLFARMSLDVSRDEGGVHERDGGGDGSFWDEDGVKWPVWRAQGEKNRDWYVGKGFEEVGRFKGVGGKLGKR